MKRLKKKGELKSREWVFVPISADGDRSELVIARVPRLFSPQ